MRAIESVLAVGLLGAAWSGAMATAAEPSAAPWRHVELRRFPAAEANQGVAVDELHFYAITNQAIGKYRKDDGGRVAGWKGPKDGPLHHLNAGMIRQGRLYAAHSNFPAVPMVSSVEVWDTATMQHVDSHSLGIDVGSLTWIDYRNEHWYACFAQYAKDQPRTGRDPAWTEVVEFDPQWRRTAGWVFPAGLIAKFGGASCSGGAFGPRGLLFATGHDAPELYVLAFPQAGSVLQWQATIPISAEGQAFGWDPVRPNTLYSISRRTREVIVSQVVEEPVSR